jgi:hypothetical protein
MNDELKTYLDEQFAAVRKDTAQTFAIVETSMADLGESISALATHIDERFDESQPALNKYEGHEKRIQYLEERLPKLA